MPSLVRNLCLGVDAGGARSGLSKTIKPFLGAGQERQLNHPDVPALSTGTDMSRSLYMFVESNGQ